MDAGIQIKRPVAGISIGLVTGDNNRLCNLTDIEGIEDNYGDMDFKVAGTRKASRLFNSIQNRKVSPSSSARLSLKAKEARLKILEVMQRTISAPCRK